MAAVAVVLVIEDDPAIREGLELALRRQQHVVYKRIDAEEAEKKEAAIAQRQSLGPRPGQKPVRPKKPGSTAGTATPTDADSDSPSGEANGSRPQPTTGSTGSSNGASGDAGGSGGSGAIEPRPQARKKTNRKRR